MTTSKEAVETAEKILLNLDREHPTIHVSKDWLTGIIQSAIDEAIEKLDSTRRTA